MRHCFLFVLCFVLFELGSGVETSTIPTNSLQPDVGLAASFDERPLGFVTNGRHTVVVFEKQIQVHRIAPMGTTTHLDLDFAYPLDSTLSTLFDIQFVEDRLFYCTKASCWLWNVQIPHRHLEQRFQFPVPSDVSFNSISSVLLDDRILMRLTRNGRNVGRLISVDIRDGRQIGTIEEHRSILQLSNDLAFEHSGHSYFLGSVTEIDQSVQSIESKIRNVTRVRLSRLCNGDHSRDLITRVDIHLHCGEESKDYNRIVPIKSVGAFYSADKSSLHLLYRELSDDRRVQICSYRMAELDMYFEKVWDICQTIENESDFKDACFEQSFACYTYSWSRTADLRCERFNTGRGGNHTVPNCKAPPNSDTGRNGWLENFRPFYGKKLSAFSTDVPILEMFDSGDGETFFAHFGNGTLKRMAMNSDMGVEFAGWSVETEAVEWGRIHYPEIDDRIPTMFFLNNTEMRSLQFTCRSMFPNCSQIKWNDPLGCGFCGFADKEGYTVFARNEEQCTADGGRLLTAHCPPRIVQMTMAEDEKVHIIGAEFLLFVNPQVSVCGQNCVIDFVFESLISCTPEEFRPNCPVELTGDIPKAAGYTVYFKGDAMESEPETDADRRSGRTKKVVAAIFAGLICLCLILFIAYFTMVRVRKIVSFHSKCWEIVQRGRFGQIHGHDIEINHWTPDGRNPYHTVSTVEPDQFITEQLKTYGIPHISEKDMEQVKILGRGYFAEVYLYRNRTGKHFAVKELRHLNDSVSLAKALEEVALSTRLHHANVVSSYGCFQHPLKQYLCIVMEFMAGGDLHTYLNDGSNVFVCRDAISFVEQIAEGMIYLVSERTVHRDLAARNCMLSADHSVLKITDFGLGRKTDQNAVYAASDPNARLPLRWTAIECLNSQSVYFSEKSDIWSFGVVCWEIFTRCIVPYPDFSINDDILRLLNGGGRLGYPGPQCPEEIYQLMCDCWAHDPKKRPTFLELRRRLSDIVAILENRSNYYDTYLTPRLPTTEGLAERVLMEYDKETGSFVVVKRLSADDQIISTSGDSVTKRPLDDLPTPEESPNDDETRTLTR